MNEQPYCSVVSQEVGELLLGSAPLVKVWFLLEYNRPWGAKATEENELPVGVQQWLQQQVNGVENGRLQFIRRQTPSGGITFFILVADEQTPRLYPFHLETYTDLFALDMARIVAGQVAAPVLPGALPLYLVCTNARRDRCCGVFGAALYRQLLSLVPNQVWQTTHLGGHRFAPTLLTLPDGVYYGRLSPDHLPEFLTSTQQGQLYLPGYRGRTCYSEPVQAAEWYLRQRVGRFGTADFRLISAQKSENVWRVLFQEGETAVTHTLHLREEPTLLPIHASCGKPETKPISQFREMSGEINHE